MVVGTEVTTSTVIGWMGTSGNSNGAHLHFEIRLNSINGLCVDPEKHVILDRPICHTIDGYRAGQNRCVGRMVNGQLVLCSERPLG